MDKGLGGLTALVFTSLFGIGVYVAYNIFPFYYYYFEIQNQFEAATRIASSEPDSEIRTRLMYHIKKMDLPIAPEDLKISRERNVITIHLEYVEIFSIFWKDREYELWQFPFVVHAEREF